MSLRVKYDSIDTNIIYSTLQERSDDILLVGNTYSVTFIGEDDSEIITELVDLSNNPTSYNKFSITTLISTGSTASNIPFSKKGWYDYNINKDDLLLEFGMCYIYDNIDDVENRLESVSYKVEKKKYIYKK
jgi:hypothetical protein